MEEKLRLIIDKLDKSLQQSAGGNDIRFQAAFSYSFIDPSNTPDQQLRTLEYPLNGVAAMLQLIERYPDIHYFYEPDYLCFYFEHYYGKGYEELLFESVKNSPMSYSLHLLHRVINDNTNPHRDTALEIMRAVVRHMGNSETIRADAAERIAEIEERERPLAVKPENYQVISLQEAIARFDLENLLLRKEDKQSVFGPEMLEDRYHDPLVIVFEGDTQFEENVRLNDEIRQSLSQFGRGPVSDFHKLLLGGHSDRNRILIVHGNLEVHYVDMSSLDCFFVFGNLLCNKIRFYEGTRTYIQGNLHAKQAILGTALSDDDCFMEENGIDSVRILGTVYTPRVQTWYLRLSHLNWDENSGKEFAEDEELAPEAHLTDKIWSNH